MLLYVHRDHKDYYGRGVQDGHLDFDTVQLLNSETSVTLIFRRMRLIWLQRWEQRKTKLSCILTRVSK